MWIEARPVLDPELGALIAVQQHEGGQGFATDDCAEWFVTVVGGRAVACGAWQPLPEPGEAELKRVYVRPAFRGRGIARHMILALEEEALAAGRPVIRLTTGNLPAAVALYQSSGYRRITSGDSSRVRFEKHLAALVQ
ncbi:GNAT family N-acetyltransferase [Actinoplanes solisilvae]|uniref:GNAT family N-acetyltransferase n=1 Tax=Actinoplanes solisilvae TaxID=2486853 RepID=UPI000FD9B3DB|nr:GNAT family N-acetyltransferase [Actinoplanes solisilvae]